MGALRPVLLRLHVVQQASAAGNEASIRPGLFGHAVVICESVMKGIVESPESRMAGFVSSSPVSDEWHAFMLSTLSEITAVQCRPLGGFAYPNRHEDVMADYGNGQDGDDNDDELDDETLAEQISRLGLNYGPGYDNDGDDDDENEGGEDGDDSFAAAALAAARGQGSVFGAGFGVQPPGMDTPSAAGKDDEEGWDVAGSEGQGEDGSGIESGGQKAEFEENSLSFGISVDSSGDADGSTGRRDTPIFASFAAPQVADAFATQSSPPEEEGAAAAAGDAFADFDAFPTSSAVQNSLEADTASGSASGVPGSSEPEADDFANWGDGDFTSAESSSTVKGTHAIFANARRCLS